MIKNKVYYKAAKLISNGESPWCCLAISDATKPGFCNSYVSLFESYFKPENSTGYDFWFGTFHIEENQLARSLALLFMHEIVNDV